MSDRPPDPRTPIDYDAEAPRYARQRRPVESVLHELLAGGAVTAASRVLEIGCGTGNYIEAIAARSGCAAWGVDRSPGMLARTPRASRVVYARESAEELPGSLVEMDLVFNVDVVHHLRDTAAAFRAMHRALRPGGRACTVTDSEEAIRRRSPLSRYWPETAQVDLARYPAMDLLERQMAEAGFARIAVRGVREPLTLHDAERYRQRAFSSLRLISQRAFERGLAELERDLAAAPVHGHIEYDLLWGEA